MPVVFAGFFLIARKSHQGAIAWLGFASIFFYAYWSLYALPIMAISICVNYWLGLHLSNPNFKYRQPLLVVAITLNLLVLGYFKYANFFIANTNALRSAMGMESLSSFNIILPIGISFFTFTQIAFLVDSYQDRVKERSFFQYVLFVSFFPHLLAGPVIHHKQMMQQFFDPKTFRIDHEKIKLGIVIFTIGLAKKILLADPIGEYADIFFNGVQSGQIPHLMISWLGSLAYTFQIYFDFSGYSDMAVGISLFFGIWLPFNFNSPFKATSMIDFWQRWHMSLTKYINEYLYTPITLKLMRIGMGKSLAIEKIYSLIIPTILVMLIVGLWHGSNWTFVVFGGMHGVILVINHLWRKRKFFVRPKNIKASPLSLLLSWALTFLCIMTAMVMFRSDSIKAAIEVYKGMLGFNLTSYMGESKIHNLDLFSSLKIFLLTMLPELNNQQLPSLLFLVVASFGIILYFPNSVELAHQKNDQLKKLLNKYYVFLMLGFLFSTSLLLLNKNSPFLYLQF